MKKKSSRLVCISSLAILLLILYELLVFIAFHLRQQTSNSSITASSIYSSTHNSIRIFTKNDKENIMVKSSSEGSSKSSVQFQVDQDETRFSFAVGDVVEADWNKKGIYYSGKVKAISYYSKYSYPLISNITIQYDDDEGDIETLEPKFVRHFISPVDIPHSVLLHVGKAGGGSMREVFQLWKAKTSNVCHPEPCPIWTAEAKVVFITLRDPVDRFVSAFYWRSILLCRTYNETRQGVDVRNDQASKDPVRYCKLRGYKNSTRERDILHHKYKFNVNELAEELCNYNPRRDDVKSEAFLDLKNILHARNSFTDWLPSKDLWMDENKNQSKLLPIIIEPGFNYTRIVSHQIKFAIQESFGTDMARMHERYFMNQLYNQIHSSEFKPHASNAHSSSTHSRRYERLMSLGECCMARYFQADYKFILDIARTSCHADQSVECRRALESMYTRRAHFLEDLHLNSDEFCKHKILKL